MQLHEIVYLPKKGEESAEVVEHFPLPDRFPSLALRAIHPRHKVFSVRPFGQPLIDRGQYLYWHLSFSYAPGPYIGNLGDDEASRQASAAVSEAGMIVECALMKLGVEHCHAYSWPDGSLYFVIRRTQDDLSALIPRINAEMRAIYDEPVTLRWSYTRDKKTKKREYLKSTYGTRLVSVSGAIPIEDPWESDPHKMGCLNWVDYFERDLSWRRERKSGEDVENPQHQAFRAGMEEAFGHQRLFHYRVRPSEYALKKGREPATNEECAAYVAAYVLGKVLLALRLPAGVSQKPWRLLLDEDEARHFV